MLVQSEHVKVGGYGHVFVVSYAFGGRNPRRSMWAARLVRPIVWLCQELVTQGREALQFIKIARVGKVQRYGIKFRNWELMVANSRQMWDHVSRGMDRVA